MVVGLVTAGCGGIAPTSPVPSPAPRPATSAPVSSAASVRLPPAADGTDIYACFDGNCEVDVKTGQLLTLLPEASSPPPTIAVVSPEAISGGVVELQINVVSGFADFHLTCTGGTPPCQVIPNAFEVTGGPGSVVTANELTIRIEAVGTDRAVIKLSLP